MNRPPMENVGHIESDISRKEGTDMQRPRLLRRKRYVHTVGEPPGTVSVGPHANPPAIRVIAYDAQRYTEETIEDVAQIKEYLGRWPVTWVNVDGLGDVRVIEELGDLFGIHRLALEDVVHLHQRPKVEEYDNLLFFVLRMLEPDRPVRTEQVSLFLGEGFVLTFQEHAGDCLGPLCKRIKEAKGRIRTMGADYLAYAILDAIVDGYYPYLDELSEHIERLEDEAVSEADPAMASRIHGHRRDLLAVRRALAPLREAVNGLLRDRHRLIAETTMIYLRDCYDHTVQLLDSVDTSRELVGGLLDVYLSSVSNRMNEVMKVLTMMATLFIPLGFLAGLYGMNFDPDASPWNMPELRWRYGYPAFLVFLVAVVVGQLLYFRRQGWLGRRHSRSKKSKEKEDPLR